MKVIKSVCIAATFLMMGCFGKAPPLETYQEKDIDEIEIAAYSRTGYAYISSIEKDEEIGEALELLNKYSKDCCTYPFGGSSASLPYRLTLKKEGKFISVRFFGNSNYSGQDEPYPHRGRGLAAKEAKALNRSLNLEDSE